MMTGFLRSEKAFYQLIQPLGRGGFGKVYLAQDYSNRQLVAIKFLDKPFDQEARRRFRREGVILSSQRANRFVINLLDHNLESHQPFLVLEYGNEGSLRDWVIQRREWREVASVLTHVAAGLKLMHEAGGFHRDIKPDNLLVCRAANGEVLIKLSDFGLARLPNTSAGAFTQTPMGTIGYIAPEVVDGQMYTTAADVYSFGITAIELLTGSKDAVALANTATPSELCQLLQSMISFHPQHRPTILNVHRRLEKILSGQSSISSGEFVTGLVLGVGLLAVIRLLAGDK